MGEPIVLRGLTKEQANAVAQFHRNHGATADKITPEGVLFTLQVTYPETSAATTPEASNTTSPRDEADLIPDWAAIAVLVGGVLAVVGFVAAWATEKSWAPIFLTIGLIIAAIGMRTAEKAVNLVVNGAR
jgi:hypothetical protein